MSPVTLRFPSMFDTQCRAWLDMWPAQLAALPLYTMLGRHLSSPYLSIPSTNPHVMFNKRLTKCIETPCLNHISGRPLAPDLKSDQALQRIRDWLKDCTQTHKHDNRHKHQSVNETSTARPTILLDVGSTEDAYVRLVENEGAATGRYIALSYVWGVTFTEELKQLYLRTGNKCDYLHEVPSDDLPGTIQYAIVVTRGLGIRYLWVDAFCIVQDDKDLKDKEILKMHDIYAGSYLTIQAACTRTVYDHFLVQRGRHLRSDVRVRYDRKGSTNTPEFIYMRPAELSTQHGGLVETRAWCYEEFTLPERLLVYAKEQMYYCCGKGVVCEGDQPRNPVSSHAHGALRRVDPPIWFKGLNPVKVPPLNRKKDSKLDYLRLWYSQLDSEYTPRFVIHSIDRLRAIAGIAKALQQRNTDMGFYGVGLWLRDLPWGLLWRTRRFWRRPFESQVMRKEWRCNYGECLMFRPLLENSQYRVPSWSWASLMGPIYHAFDERFWLTLLVDDAIEYPPHNDFLGKGQLFEITLSAPTKLAHVSPILRTPQELKDGWQSNKKPLFYYSGKNIDASVTVLLSSPSASEELPDHIGIAIFDIAQEEKESHGGSVLCIFISEEVGLMVKPVDETGRVKYRRLGIFLSCRNFYEGEPKIKVTLI